MLSMCTTFRARQVAGRALEGLHLTYAIILGCGVVGELAVQDTDNSRHTTSEMRELARPQNMILGCYTNISRPSGICVAHGARASPSGSFRPSLPRPLLADGGSSV
ncbi:hypothetical protein FKP32DRAFT_209445 [Trametes sanguinea]|nr:hypothetical protein FKP32DRAFT_209445 [Trametes sanguinea]